ncbi:hypothetical protein Avbf_12633 [Armadillidium vulgare]|nr:hypothetical protein Avbf_12633 [Armadillidium vulgare]
MDEKPSSILNNDSFIPFNSNTEESDRGRNRKSDKYFIPNIFKENPAKPYNISASDPFITDHSAKEYCSLFATDEKDVVPKYLYTFKDFIDNVLDIPDDVFEDIAKVHIEREEKFKELEDEEEKQEAQNHALQLKEKNSMDNKVKRLLNSRRYYVKRCCPVKIPFKSTLSHEEHDFYIRCFFKFQFRSPVNSLEEKEYEQYMSMQNRVFDEQSCMMNFSFKVSQMVLKQYNEVPEVINDYIEEYVAHRCKRAFNYPSFYKGEIEIPLKAQIQEASSEKHFQFTHVGHLLSLGSIPWLYLPNPKIKTSLPKDDDTLLENKNPICDNNFDRSTYLFKCPVSEDPNAEYLAKTYNASVVITPSAFKTIVDNQEQPYDKEWNIPVKIKSYKIKDENGKEKDTRIIYIDKPLVKKSWLPLQKKYTYFKTAAKAVLTGSLHRVPKPYKFRKHFVKPKQERLVLYGDSIFSDSTSDDGTVENFATHSPSEVKNNNNRKRLLSEELERDLFISEDEEESRSSFDQDFKNTSTENCGGFTASTTADTNGSVTITNVATSSNTTSTIVTTTTAFNNNVTSDTTAVSNNTVTKSNTTVADHTITTTVSVVATSNKDNNNIVNDDHSRHTTSKAAIPPPLSYKSVKTRNTDKSLGNLKGTPKQEHRSSYKNLKKDHSSPNRTEGFLDTLLDTQDSFLKLKTSQSGKGSEANDPLLNTYGMNNPSQYIDFFKPWENTIHKEWDENIQIKDCPPKSFDSNVHYQLFSFENTVHGPCKEDSEKPVRILVRHSIHGLVKNMKKRKKKVTFQTIMKEAKACLVVPKIENQIYFGAEVNIRACTESADIVLIQEKNFESVLKDGKQKHINFNPQSLIYKEAEAGYVYSSSIDLHKMYSDKSVISKQYRTPPWLAIDTHVFTPFHLTHHKIPATFPMENVSKLNKNEKTRRKVLTMYYGGVEEEDSQNKVILKTASRTWKKIRIRQND